MLSTGLPEDQARALAKELNDLAGHLGKWAQLLKLVNGFLRERVIDGGEPPQVAVADADARLTEEGLDTFSADDEADRTKRSPAPSI